MYYFIRQDLNDVTNMVFLGHSKESGKHLWVNGARFSEPYPDHDIFYIEPCMGVGNGMPDFFDSAAPIMSDKLLGALKSLGVENYDSYPVILEEKGTGKQWHNYFAVNVIGLVDALDTEKSDIEDEDIFHSTVIDENKTMGMPCFRLLNGPTVLMISESVAKPLIDMNLIGVLIINSEDFDEDDY